MMRASLRPFSNRLWTMGSVVGPRQSIQRSMSTGAFQRMEHYQNPEQNNFKDETNLNKPHKNNKYHPYSFQVADPNASNSKVSAENGGRQNRVDRDVPDMLEERLKYDIVNKRNYNQRRFVKILAAWARTNRRDAGSRADSLVTWMEENEAHLPPDVTADAVVYSALINVFARSRERGAAWKAEAVLDRMQKRNVKPDTICYSSIIDAWSRSGQRRLAAERAEFLLSEMESLHKAGVPNVKPNTIVFNTVMAALAKSGQKDAPRKIEAIIKRMEKLRMAGHANIQPDTTSFLALIQSYAQLREAHRAEEVHNQMEQMHRGGHPGVQPNVFTFSALVNAWARSGNKDAAQKALAILNRMQTLHETGSYPNVFPDTVTFNTVLNALAQSSGEDEKEVAAAARQAEEVLARMVQLRNEGKHHRIQPDTISYNCLINAWSRSRASGSVGRVEAIVRLMEELDETGVPNIKPNDVTYKYLREARMKPERHGEPLPH